ncbi:hypothetical protein J7E83_02100 [Arthrobacter sp. ISL-48]|uniref:hypothetical protein n=1 Tax=Arthrobacter sp. ISL-48 TaxID=2819110 RepID=UPI001BE673E2|nr:hypothetical protein [Arthrobacter sp. ISL-48]MBT2530933.1 hypothetical protein [Arthrobacter sp. ISL-48]
MLIGPGRARAATARPARRGPLLAACVAALAVLTACSGGVTETVTTAVKDSASAVATARLAMAQDMAGKLTRAATSTALDDALKEVQTSRDTVLKLSPATPEDRDAQQEALAALDSCSAGFNTARNAVSTDDGGPSLSDGDHALATAEDALKNLKAKVGDK